MLDSVIRASAPGSIMLMGEHSVLFGERALACAVDKHIHVTLTPRDDRVVNIDSSLADYSADLDDLKAEAKLSFVLAVIEQHLDDLHKGFDLKIEAGFGHTLGLGSSAAVTVATTAALDAYCQQASDSYELFRKALATVHKVQGRGSGTDLAASVFGASVGYTVNPCQIEPLGQVPQLSLYYVGYKTTTPEVLRQVEQHTKTLPELYQKLYWLMGQCTFDAEAALAKQDWQALGQCMNVYQGLMDALGVNDLALSDLVYRLRQSSKIYGAKISGSGLGDCVLALGSDPELALEYQEIPVSLSPQGVSVEIY